MSLKNLLCSLVPSTKEWLLQLWKNGKKQEEVIGSHKAYIVVNEVRQMIENEGTI